MTRPASPIRVVVVPSAPALLPEHAGLTDPVAEVRAAALDACRWLAAAQAPVVVLGADDLALRVGRHLLSTTHTGPVQALALPDTPAAGELDALLVVADGTARRSEKAPGHLDERAAPYDEAIGRALADGDFAALAALDLGLGAELLAAGAPTLAALGGLLGGRTVGEARTTYADDPYGVAYWVTRWTVSP
ncbi:hypothetical protein [Nocardioides sp. CFH 31398]|uniref:hypothetical protein n=1 Tax=Nocardioides sp. CFH 31398 TaxID=2919579 RepID=UPI001F052620|nr:hypothetical protein [Nocardioides sp. CFH 31398]MCH1865965.1 hypothetical protein [Nocardioides sp. CFH 31398]